MPEPRAVIFADALLKLLNLLELEARADYPGIAGAATVGGRELESVLKAIERAKVEP